MIFKNEWEYEDFLNKAKALWKDISSEEKKEYDNDFELFAEEYQEELDYQKQLEFEKKLWLRDSLK